MDASLFLTWTEDRLKTELEKALTELATGKTVISAGAGDVNGSKQVFNSPAERAATFQRALYLKNPDSYPEFALAGCGSTIACF